MEKSKEMRLFIAIDMPKELKSGIAALKKELNLDGIKFVEDENLHITMKFLGEVRHEKLGEIENALRGIKFQKFAIRLQGAGVFPNEDYVRVIWMGCESEELIELGNKINEALAPLFKKEDFTPHLTIARVKKKVDLKEFLVRHKKDEFGEFECNRFVLKSSILSKEGPKYENVTEFTAV